ncbi:MAG: hypothetical protein M9916_06620 [Crocinitomicaceae bacterium]|nr:hypothetical protein [Crocinitomicaceae bacterium]
MEDVLKTTLLEFEKSAFIIDLVKHDNGKQYIRILQTIRDEETSKKRAIKLNPSILSDIIKVLNYYNELINDEQIKTTNQTKNKHIKIITESDKTAIQNRYLKGLSIAELTVQFDCEAELIKQVLRNNNIKIVDDNSPNSYHHKKFRRKNK